MKLKQYMETHEGQYLVAETTREISVENLDASLGELDVEPHLFGIDAAGRRRIHLYGTDWRCHVVTHVHRSSAPDEAAPVPCRRGIETTGVRD